MVLLLCWEQKTPPQALQWCLRAWKGWVMILVRPPRRLRAGWW